MRDDPAPLAMQVGRAALGGLMPLYLWLDDAGRLVDAGPTLRKLIGADALGQPLTRVFDLVRPRALASARDLIQAGALRLGLRAPPGTMLKGIAVPLQDQGVLVNLSFGYGLREAVRDHELSDTDFAATDLGFELLFLAEANAAIQARARRFSERLRQARMQATEQALTDPLTGLRNRRGLDQVLDRLRAEGRALALIHVDLDHFKQINDTLGHAAGDLVLQAVGQRLAGAVRGNDTVARVGGDEFVVLLPGMTNRAGVETVAGRILHKLAEPVPTGGLEGVAPGTTMAVSASLGVVIRTGAEVVSIDALLNLADRALYRSKNAGRGTFTFAEP